MNPITRIKTLAIRGRGPIPRRVLGNTGLEVTILGLGGESIIKIVEKYDEAVELIQASYQMGINYFDTAPGYYPSEIRVGDALQGVRKNIVLATKTDDRTRDGSWRLLEKSLQNLKTDYIDIWQIHHIDRQDEVRAILQKDGALTAMREAKEQRIIRFMGVTGHYDYKPLLSAITCFPFDTILMALNAADVHQDSFIRNLLPEAVGRKMGIIGMKIFARGKIFEPTKLNSPADALNYVLSLPVSLAIAGHDSLRQLIDNIQIAQDFSPLSRTQQDKIEEKTKTYAQSALFFHKGNEQFATW